MNQEQANRIVGAIRTLDSSVKLLQNELNNRLDNVERRLTNSERTIVRTVGPNAVPAVPSFSDAPSIYQPTPPPPPPVYGPPPASHGYVQTPPQNANALPAPRTVGSRLNASFLPYAMEMIGACGAPTYSVNCFRDDHYRWCRVHQRPILKPHNKCGRAYDGCSQVKWEHHINWNILVQQSYAAGYLGKKGVHGLDEVLFPRNLYPQKYNAQGWYTG
ncbi:uncharacterized protein K460DRAFT_395211 [Cucurbitaria berberidis CBS 394.84]|uniref:Uncharacterized protein n=1 Tax=Cucurbitaria berberidis CBS 394.84 TaxID=1168544 RepID=A0A9P4GGC9_9PLEO|nr:uncharacterized protein K460DRAFT_395211 [Cucurbitaria berberidis CBS 394.84]KAF1845583.1 hypothetical protein K460DRAFT_395211 [Cucurbitaria berberidis CBS 394.84]